MMLAAPACDTDDNRRPASARRFRIQIGDANVHAGPGESHRGGKAQSGRASGDDGDIVG